MNGRRHHDITECAVVAGLRGDSHGFLIIHKCWIVHGLDHASLLGRPDLDDNCVAARRRLVRSRLRDFEQSHILTRFGQTQTHALILAIQNIEPRVETIGADRESQPEQNRGDDDRRN